MIFATFVGRVPKELKYFDTYGVHCAFAGNETMPWNYWLRRELFTLSIVTLPQAISYCQTAFQFSHRQNLFNCNASVKSSSKVLHESNDVDSPSRQRSCKSLTASSPRNVQKSSWSKGTFFWQCTMKLLLTIGLVWHMMRAAPSGKSLVFSLMDDESSRDRGLCETMPSNCRWLMCL